MVTDPYWNHNVHHHPAVLAAVPDGCRTALDAGCGDGLLARKLAARSASVTGVDRSPEMIELARGHAGVPGNVAYLEADYLAYGALPERAYDFVSAVAVVHHAPFEEAVTRLARLTAPGGRLVIVGMAANRTPLDWLISACGVPASLLHARRNGGKRGPVGMPMEDVHMSWGRSGGCSTDSCPAAPSAARCCGATSWCGTDHEEAAPEVAQGPPPPYRHTVTRRRPSASPEPARGS
ncbi:class I SAM-dependent methyltransferase [Streptomyces luteogriseus]|uniref:class I SAM-dependent methyltransferase n=1 Tax=Streptomyces luteogriseus TaxID=68233 RepID=UPI002E33A7BB|nr:class I SAM-dependent methyltransferase [Streptomyces luteogriseus]WTJ27994.1 class I SAM-dependent methyltransferase [Streptomyces luteogriseus]